MECVCAWGRGLLPVLYCKLPVCACTLTHTHAHKTLSCSTGENPGVLCCSEVYGSHLRAVQKIVMQDAIQPTHVWVCLRNIKKKKISVSWDSFWTNDILNVLSYLRLTDCAGPLPPSWRTTTGSSLSLRVSIEHGPFMSIRQENLNLGKD